MKKIFLVLALCLVPVIMLNCEFIEDNDEIEIEESSYVRSFFESENAQANLTGGCLINYGLDPNVDDDFNYEGHHQVLLLISKGINMSTNANGTLLLEGEGLLVQFRIFNESDQLTSGYSYCSTSQSETQTPWPAGTLYSATYSPNWGDNVNTPTWFQLHEGELFVEDNTPDKSTFIFYGLEYNATDNYYTEATAYFSGSVLYIDYSNN